MRMRGSFFAFRAVVHGQHIERPSNRMWLLWIEWELKPAIEAAESVLGLRVFLADYIYRQLVVFDELHTRSLSRWRIA